MRFKGTVIGIGMALAMFTGKTYGQAPQVTVSVVDTFLYPGDAGGRYLTVRMNNSVKIGGYNVGLIIENPQAINFTYFDVDTTLPYTRCFIKCTPPPCRETCFVECPDTCYDYNSQVITTGTRSQGADVIDGARLSETYLQVSCIYQTSGSPGPVIQPGNGVLFRVPLNVFPIVDSVSLAERQVRIFIDPVYTYFSDSTGNVLYRIVDTVPPINTYDTINGNVFIPYSLKGDVNFDGLLTSSDVVRLLNYAFLGVNQPIPSASVGDVNCDGLVNSSDVVLEMNKIFLGIPFPC